MKMIENVRDAGINRDKEYYFQGRGTWRLWDVDEVGHPTPAWGVR